MASPANPEVYWAKPSSQAPNSNLPVLVYRNVLPTDQGEEAILKAIEANNWEKKGTWGHIPKAHYHTITHECYAPISGWTKSLYGVWETDDPENGIRFDLKVGDVAVHAAGIAHSHVESSEDYRYFGYYPKGSPFPDSVYIELPNERKLTKAESARSCPIPDFDPVFGRDGPLPKLWREAAAAAGESRSQAFRSNMS